MELAVQVTAPSEPIVRLREAGEHVSDSLRSEILALGPSVVPELIALLEDEEAAMEDSPGDGWGPIHAVEFLVDLKANEAIEPLLRALAVSKLDEVIHSKITIRLPKLGTPVLEPALRMMDEDVDDDILGALYSIISELGVRDERIFTRICDYFDAEPVLGAICLGSYGDARGLPLLREAIEEFEPDWEFQYGLMELTEFVESYELIAGALPEDLAETVRELRAEWKAHAAERWPESTPETSTSNKIGRNDPCPCGSGKKYKKCCQNAPTG